MNISRPLFTDGFVVLPKSKSPTLGLADSPKQRKNSLRMTPNILALPPAVGTRPHGTAILGRHQSREWPVFLLLAAAGVAEIILALMQAFGP